MNKPTDTELRDQLLAKGVLTNARVYDDSTYYTAHATGFNHKNHIVSVVYYEPDERDPNGRLLIGRATCGSSRFGGYANNILNNRPVTCLRCNPKGDA